MLSVESEQEQLKFSTCLLQTEADEDEEGDADKIDIRNAHIELEAELQHHQSRSQSSTQSSSQGYDDLDPSKVNENDDDIECLQLDTLAHTYLRIENYRRLEVSKVRPILLRPPPTKESVNAPYGSLEAIRAASATKQQPTAYNTPAAPMQKLQPIPQPVPQSSNPHMANAIPRARPHYRPIVVPPPVSGSQTTYLATAQSLIPDLVTPSSYASPRPSTTWNSSSTSVNQQPAQLAINPSIVATSSSDSSSHAPSSASYRPNPTPKVSLMSPTEASSLASNLHQLPALASLSPYTPASSGHLYQNGSSSTVTLPPPQSAAMNIQKHTITTAPANHASFSQSMPTMGSRQAPSRKHEIIEILDD